jgi:hypothetical protein
MSKEQIYSEIEGLMHVTVILQKFSIALTVHESCLFIWLRDPHRIYIMEHVLMGISSKFVFGFAPDSPSRRLSQ